MAWTFIHGYNARFFHGGRACFGILYERNPYFRCIYLEYQNAKIYHHANIGRIAHEPMAALQGTVGSVRKVKGILPLPRIQGFSQIKKNQWPKSKLAPKYQTQDDCSGWLNKMNLKKQQTNLSWLDSSQNLLAPKNQYFLSPYICICTSIDKAQLMVHLAKSYQLRTCVNVSKLLQLKLYDASIGMLPSLGRKNRRKFLT